MGICMESGCKKWVLHIPLSRSFQVIKTDTDWSATYDFLLVIHSNQGPISYCFRIQTAISVEKKNHNFSHPCAFNAPPPAKGFPVEFCNGNGDWITRTIPLPAYQNVMICAFIQTQHWHWTDKTDRETEMVK